MNTPYECEVFDDVVEFGAEVGGWLADGPLSGNVPAGLVAQRAAGIVATEPEALWIKVSRSGETAGVVVQTPPRGLLFTDMDSGAVDAVADTIARIRPRVPGANGPKEITDRFAALWSVRTGCAARIGFSSRQYQVTEVDSPTGVAGDRRPAGPGDRETVAAWLSDFAATATASETPGIQLLIDTYDARLAAGQPQWIWDVDGEPVSFAMESLPSGGVVRIQAVYTPESRRGNGYASALVAEISAGVLARDGVRACTLYTDLANPTSNGIYQRIGYAPIGDSANYEFEYPALVFTASSSGRWCGSAAPRRTTRPADRRSGGAGRPPRVCRLPR